MTDDIEPIPNGEGGDIHVNINLGEEFQEMLYQMQRISYNQEKMLDIWSEIADKVKNG